jgi:hypothetical protein
MSLLSLERDILDSHESAVNFGEVLDLDHPCSAASFAVRNFDEKPVRVFSGPKVT